MDQWISCFSDVCDFLSRAKQQCSIENPDARSKISGKADLALAAVRARYKDISPESDAGAKPAGFSNEPVENV